MKRATIAGAYLFLMTGLVICLTACSAPQSEAQHSPVHSEATRMGSHGMAVIGDTDLLFAHMALYRRPHDRQILTPATFRSPEAQANFTSWRASYQGLVSIVPETFDLDRLAPDTTDPISSFSADIYEGHFERGGTLKFKDVAFDLGQPLLHLKVTNEMTEQVDFVYIEHGAAAYLVRHIGHPPGKDQIVLVPPSDELMSGDHLRALPRSQSDTKWTFRRADGSTLVIFPIKTVYLETADFVEP